MSCRFAILAAALLACAAHAGDRLVPVSAAQRASLRIVSIPMVADTGAVSVGLPATVAIPPAQERVVAAPVSGLVAEVRVAVGEKVRAGQPLVRLRSEQLASAQRELAQYAVQVNLAEEVARRDEGLFKEGIIAESRLQASRAGLQQARAALAERRAWLRLMGMSGSAMRMVERGEGMVDSITLVAPIAGVVMAQQATVGARVEPAMPLFQVARLDPLWLDIQAPAETAAMVRPGQSVTVPGLSAQGKVVMVGQSVNAAQTVLIRARVGNAEGRLRLNQSVTARLEGISGARQWRVPVRAIARHQGQSYVFVEMPGGFEPQAVKVLSQSAQMTVVDGPFTGNERIAVEGVVALKAAWLGMGGE